ncbi:MAG: MATE family efflux transporter [Ruthenibacterium lactatiformans]
MEERRENIMGTQPINRLLPSMAFPIMLSMLVQALYNVVDSVFVSMVSENALTSVSLAFPVQNLMIACPWAPPWVHQRALSRRLGEKTDRNKVAENGIFVTMLSWAVFAVFGAACSGLFMGAFTQNAEILAGGTDYMWIVTVFSLGLFMSVTMERVLQVTGKTVYQMISQMTGAVVNIILDPVFIFGWLGLPAGVAGAARLVIGQFCGWP